MVTTEIESLLARVFAWVNAGPEAIQGRGVCGRGWNGGDQVERQCKWGEEGEKVHFD